MGTNLKPIEVAAVISVYLLWHRAGGSRLRRANQWVSADEKAISMDTGGYPFG
jgi:hypothetical protein